MVKIILLIRNAAIIPDPAHPSALQHRSRCPVNGRFQSDLPEILHGSADHPFKTKTVADVYNLFLRNILISCLKADPVAFRIGVCHLRNHLFRKGI